MESDELCTLYRLIKKTYINYNNANGRDSSIYTFKIPNSPNVHLVASMKITLPSRTILIMR